MGGVDVEAVNRLSRGQLEKRRLRLLRRHVPVLTSTTMVGVKRGERMHVREKILRVRQKPHRTG